ncbi:hypothetical protein [Sphingobacterium sp. JB170]|uniref:hypothetical protein n=1 Tax=Sphingobacterium sp. JB170 TaxID=1434842 RepID=UPI001C50231D|nr:hypothetical protein [Sphingobacterium sp. JB170]
MSEVELPMKSVSYLIFSLLPVKGNFILVMDSQHTICIKNIQISSKEELLSQV